VFRGRDRVTNSVFVYKRGAGALRATGSSLRPSDFTRAGFCCKTRGGNAREIAGSEAVFVHTGLLKFGICGMKNETSRLCARITGLSALERRGPYHSVGYEQGELHIVQNAM